MASSRVAPVPAADQPHHRRHAQAEDGDRGEGRQAELDHAGVERAQRQDAGLLVEVLHRDRAAGAHQVVAAVLQQRVHRHHQVAADRAHHHQERHRRPDVGEEVQPDHQEAHRHTQRQHADRAVELHRRRGDHRADHRTQDHHAGQVGRLHRAVAQRRRRPGEDDHPQVAEHAPQQRGGGQGDLAQLVGPQPCIALGEVTHQRQRVGRQRPQRRLGARNAQVEGSGDHVDQHHGRDRRLGRGVDAGVEEREVQPQQHARQARPDQLAADQDAQDDRRDRQPLDPAVGLDQLRRRQQLGEDAVLGRRVGRRAQTDHRIGQQRVAAEQHHQAAQHLDAVADEHDPALGHRVGEGADEGRQQHVEQREHRRQGRHLPGRRVRRLQQLDGGHQQRVVSQRAEELRRHDGVETLLHPHPGVLAHSLWAGGRSARHPRCLRSLCNGARLAAPCSLPGWRGPGAARL